MTLVHEAEPRTEPRAAMTRQRPGGRWILTQTALVVGGVTVYFGVRALTVGSVGIAEEHARLVVEAERALGIHVEADLQRPFEHPGTLQTLANWTYIWGHWPVIIATMLWLAFRHGAVLLRLRDAMMVSGTLGMVVFASFPVAPPRLAGLGLVDTVMETSRSYRVLQPPGLVNQYAAMPSLHVGWDLLVGIAIVTAAGSVLLRLFGYLMPVVMAVAVVVTANHYVLDVLVGIAFVLVGHAAALGLERRRGQTEEVD
jgi:hypothetical protein